MSAAIVTHCKIGQYCPTWVYLMTQGLGYINVCLYENAMQD